MRSVAGYVTNGNRKRDRKKAQKKLNKNLKEENLNRLLEPEKSLFLAYCNGRLQWASTYVNSKIKQ